MISHSRSPLVDTAYRLMGPGGTILLTAGVVASVGGNLTSSMFTIPRITYRLSHDGLLPQWFSFIHPSYKTPIWSIVFFGVVCFGLAAGGSFASLASLSVVTRVLLYLICVAGLRRVEKAMASVTGALRLPGRLLLPLLAASVCVLLLSQTSVQTWGYLACFLLVGAVLFIAGARGSAAS